MQNAIFIHPPSCPSAFLPVLCSLPAPPRSRLEENHARNISLEKLCPSSEWLSEPSSLQHVLTNFCCPLIRPSAPTDHPAAAGGHRTSSQWPRLLTQAVGEKGIIAAQP